MRGLWTGLRSCNVVPFFVVSSFLFCCDVISFFGRRRSWGWVRGGRKEGGAKCQGKRKEGTGEGQEEPRSRRGKREHKDIEGKRKKKLICLRRNVLSKRISYFSFIHSSTHPVSHLSLFPPLSLQIDPEKKEGLASVSSLFTCMLVYPDVQVNKNMTKRVKYVIT